MGKKIVVVVGLLLLMLLAYNWVFHGYSMGFSRVCGTGWQGFGRFMIWGLALAGLVIGVYFFSIRETKCNQCGNSLEASWKTCPHCGDDIP